MKSKIVKMTSEKANKIARGYRLKPETHQLIVRIQKILKTDQDTVISGACNMYFELLLNKHNK
jgi:hypothetical protein